MGLMKDQKQKRHQSSTQSYLTSFSQLDCRELQKEKKKARSKEKKRAQGQCCPGRVNI